MRATVLLLLVACASAPPTPPVTPGSRGLRASEHITAAREHDEVARESAAYPDMRDDATGRTDQLLLATPWTRRWDTVDDHVRLAQVHRSAAAEISAEFDHACEGRSDADVSISPLVKYGIGGAPIQDGVVVYLRPEAGNPDKLMADMRCHRAWMMLQPLSTMDLCPLDLAGLSVQAVGGKEGITVTLHVQDPALVPELQKRAAHELEQGARLDKAH